MRRVVCTDRIFQLSRLDLLRPTAVPGPGMWLPMPRSVKQVRRTVLEGEEPEPPDCADSTWPPDEVPWQVTSSHSMRTRSRLKAR